MGGGAGYLNVMAPGSRSLLALLGSKNGRSERKRWRSLVSELPSDFIGEYLCTQSRLESVTNLRV